MLKWFSQSLWSSNNFAGDCQHFWPLIKTNKNRLFVFIKTFSYWKFESYQKSEVQLICKIPSVQVSVVIKFTYFIFKICSSLALVDSKVWNSLFLTSFMRNFIVFPLEVDTRSGMWAARRTDFLRNLWATADLLIYWKRFMSSWCV